MKDRSVLACFKSEVAANKGLIVWRTSQPQLWPRVSRSVLVIMMWEMARVRPGQARPSSGRHCCPSPPAAAPQWARCAVRGPALAAAPHNTRAGPGRAELSLAEPGCLNTHLVILQSPARSVTHSEQNMTVETASISTAIPPKKRDFSEYPASCSPAMSEEETHRVTPRTPSPSPSPRHQANTLSPAELHAMASKTGPLRSSGFMITDILSGAGAGLSPLSLLPQASLQSQFQRIPSPHDSDSSDAGSNKDHDISDDGDDGKF